MAKKKILKMIANWCYGDKPCDTRDWEDILDIERDNNSWWYLHGALESDVHYDKATVTNCFSGGFAKETIDWSEIRGNKVVSVRSEKPFYNMYVNGIVDVEIEGISKPCKGFFYTSEETKIIWKGKEYDHWKQKGLVCYADDTEACEYAKKKMEERSYWL